MRRVRAGDLEPHPENWRRHPDAQRSVLVDLLEEIGLADALIVRELDGGRLQLLDGHLRADVLADEQVPVLVVDLDDDEARKLLASLDPLAAMAETSIETLAALAEQIDAQTDGLKSLLAGLLGNERHQGLTEPDEVPRPRQGGGNGEGRPLAHG